MQPVPVVGNPYKIRTKKLITTTKKRSAAKEGTLTHHSDISHQYDPRCIFRGAEMAIRDYSTAEVIWAWRGALFVVINDDYAPKQR